MPASRIDRLDESLAASATKRNAHAFRYAMALRDSSPRVVPFQFAPYFRERWTPVAEF